MKRFTLAASSAVLLLCAFVRCSDPLSADEEAVVQELLRGQLPTGRYSIFWDGRDEEGNFVAAGTYYARLESRDFTYQIEMTATAGSDGESNRDEYYSNEFQALTDLAQNQPNPFRIQDGTNIRFTIDANTENVTVVLTIRDRE